MIMSGVNPPLFLTFNFLVANPTLLGVNRWYCISLVYLKL